MRLLRLPGVHRPKSDAWMLAAAVRERGWYPAADVLDLFTGSGVLAICAAREGAREVIGVDCSRRAALAAGVNALLNGARITVARGDLFKPIGDREFDVITANPPYLPAETEELPDKGIRRAWDAGLDGRKLIDRVIAEAPTHLKKGGKLVLVHSSINGEQKTLDALEEAGLRGEVIARHHGPLGGILMKRTEMMEQRGLIAPGQRDEEILVIAGRNR